MKNNNISYTVQDASSFVATVTDALLPDQILQHYANETPWFVKRAVEMLFFEGQEMGELSPRDTADAYILNALIAMQRDFKNECGGEDWDGMINAYIMKPSYEQIFRQMAEVGFSGTYSQEKAEGDWSEEDFFKETKPTPWEQRGINLN